LKASPKLREQLEKALSEINAMESSSSFDELETHWKEFLSQLERTWYKAQAHYGKSPKWKGWKGTYANKRKKDPLLLYLCTARGIHEHTLEEITTKNPGSIGIGPGPTGSGTIKHLTINNGVVSANVSSGSISITFTPDKVRILPLKVRGGVCNIPTTHLGNSVDPDNVVSLAKKGAEYYEAFLDDAENHFITKHDA